MPLRPWPIIRTSRVCRVVRIRPELRFRRVVLALEQPRVLVLRGPRALIAVVQLQVAFPFLEVNAPLHVLWLHAQTFQWWVIAVVNDYGKLPAALSPTING